MFTVHGTQKYCLGNDGAKKYSGSAVGWADIGTVARVPRRFVAYLSKVVKIE
jgi:hypothetical protein